MFEAELEFVGPVELKKAAAQLAIRYANLSRGQNLTATFERLRA